MNILYIINCDTVYGANLSMLEMIEPLRKMGHKTYVLSYKEGPITRELRNRKIEYAVVPYNVCAHVDKIFTKQYEFKLLKDNIKLLPKIHEYIKLWDIDIIHTNASNVNIGALAALRYNIPHIWHVRELLLDDYQLRYDFPKLDEFLMKKAHKVIAISRFVKNKRNLNYRNVIAIPDGLSVSRYSMERSRKLFAGEKVHILFCGVIIATKGVMDIVEAVGLLVNKYNITNISLDIAGEAGDVYDQMMAYINQNGLSDYIHYLGHQNDLTELRKQADITTVCSRSEGLGRVTIESMLSENLVIGADAGCTSDLIKNDAYGFLYEVGNAEDLAEKIVLAYRNPKECEKRIRRAKKYAEKHFDSDVYAKNIVNIYRGAILGRR